MGDYVSEVQLHDHRKDKVDPLQTLPGHHKGAFEVAFTSPQGQAPKCEGYRKVPRNRLDAEERIESIEPMTGTLADGFMLEHQNATAFYEPNISKCVNYHLGLDGGYFISKNQNPTSRWEGEGNDHHYITTIATNIEKSTVSAPKSAPATSLGKLDDNKAREYDGAEAVEEYANSSSEASMDKAEPSDETEKFRSKFAAKKPASVAGMSTLTYSPAGVIGGKNIDSVNGRPELKIGAHFTRFGFSMANLGPIFETVNMAVPGVLDRTYSDAIKTTHRTSHLPSAMRMLGRSSSKGVATIAISVACNSKTVGGKVIPSSTNDFGFSVKCHNLVHLEKVYWHGPQPSASVGVELEGAGGFGPRPEPAVAQSLLSQTGDAFGGTNPFASKPNGINRLSTSANL
ncbi:hypothetical protein DL762_004410 [Monosporascus cannonballus]|uniref:Uncharacterized protein n=1 Tax=Monosporascus cannonballus TaxID=155416 RepID=A0ABY0H7W3_9PEZI|nr:hypothetical protein DL762_004410 [Monosporascus cannonballus]